MFITAADLINAKKVQDLRSICRNLVLYYGDSLYNNAYIM